MQPALVRWQGPLPGMSAMAASYVTAAGGWSGRMAVSVREPQAAARLLAVNCCSLHGASVTTHKESYFVQ